MNAPTHTQLINKDTHNSRPSSHNCTRKRPCFREHACSVCRTNKRKFIITQACALAAKWSFTKFITITVTNHFGTRRDGYYLLANVRSKAYRRLFSSSYYFSVLSVSAQEFDRHGEMYKKSAPHLHIVTDDTVTAQILRAEFQKLLPDSNLNIQVKQIGNSIADIRRVFGYLMDQNYRIDLAYRPKRLRLLSASQGFMTGRPRETEALSWGLADAG